MASQILDLKKVLSEGNHSHYNILLGSNDTSMLNKQMPNTFQRKCPDPQNVFTKSIMINREKRDLASTTNGVNSACKAEMKVYSNAACYY